jgi:hypothetical protein
MAAAAAVVASLVVVAPAGAQSGTAKVRIAHFSPDAPAVDVYFNGVKRLTNVQYEKHSNYLELPAGKQKIEVRPTGAAADVPAVITAEPDLVANSSYTLAAVGKLDSIAGNLYADDSTAPPAGKVKLRVIHGAPELAPVDVVVKGGASLATKLAFPTASPYLSLDPGKYDVEVRTDAAGPALLASTVVLQEGGVYTIAAIGGGDKKPKLKGLIDLQATGGVGTTAAPATTAVPATAQAADADTTAGAGTETTVATETTAPETTAAADTTPAETTAPETSAPEDTTPPETTAPEDTTPPDTAAPDTTVPAVEAPAGGVESGFGGLSNGGAVGVGALAGATALALVLANQRRRSTR